MNTYTTVEATVRFEFEADDIRDLVKEVVAELNATIDWPPGRLALTEKEAAAALGVKQHVLRDLRLSGILPNLKLGRKAVYTRRDLLDCLDAVREGGRAGDKSLDVRSLFQRNNENSGR